MKTIIFGFIGTILLVGNLFAAQPFFCDYETNSCGSTFDSGSGRDTYANFGISGPTGGGSYGVKLHSTSGVDDAAHEIVYYNTNSTANPFYRIYFFLPTGYTANTNCAKTLKFMLMRSIGSGDQDLYLCRVGSNLQWNWQHSAVGYNSGAQGTNISTNAWHYLEVNLNTTTDVVKLWFDSDACDNPSSPTWTDSGASGPYNAAVTIFQLNENWSGGLAPATQNWYADHIATTNGTCIGDTLDLLGGGSPPPDPPPGSPPPPAEHKTTHSKRKGRVH